MSNLKYIWGLGIEHETALVHDTQKTLKGSEILKDYENTWRKSFDKYNQLYKSKINPDQSYQVMLFFDANQSLKELVLEQNKVTMEMLKSTQLEPDYHDFSRECKHDPTNLNWVQGNNCSLEFITRDYQNVTAEKATAELNKLQSDLLKNIKKTTYAEVQSDLYGPLKFPDLGAYRYVGYLDQSGNLKFSSNYFGSYHLNFTLPYLESDTQQIFINRHLKWAKLIQWIMPLMTAVYGTGDSGSFMDQNLLSEGSYRQVTNRFARPGTSDLDSGIFPVERVLEYGSGWVTAIMTDMEYPYNPEDKLGTDFRRDPEKGERFGFELRVFDHFPHRYLKDLILFLWYLADHSRTFKQIPSPIKDIGWKSAMKLALKEGWNAKMPIEYLRKLKIKLNLPITENPIRASEVFIDLIKGLNRKYSLKGKGYYTDIIYNRAKKPKIGIPKPIPNRNAQVVFINNYFSDQEQQKLLNSVLSKHLNKNLTDTQLSREFAEVLGDEILDEIDDLMDYLMEMKVAKKTDKGWQIKKLLKINRP